MDGELLIKSPSSPHEPESKPVENYTEVFREFFPFYLNAGMTPEQYWDGDVEWAEDFRIAYQQRLEDQNRMACIQGQYIYLALASIMPATSIKFKAKKFDPYVEKPFSVTKRQQKMEEERKRKESCLTGFEYMMRFTAAHNEKMKQEGRVNQDG